MAKFLTATYIRKARTLQRNIAIRMQDTLRHTHTHVLHLMFNLLATLDISCAAQFTVDRLLDDF